MPASSPRFATPPSAMDAASFVGRFGGIYEHSPWVAERVFEDGLHEHHDDVDGLAQAMASQVNGASAARKLALIKAHPDLAGRAALAGTLTAASTGEQASAGLDQCSEAELRQFQDYNRRYRQRFGFPFVMAVRGSNRYQILAGFEERLRHTPAVEFERAIAEIHKIARLRLQALAEDSAA